MFPNGNIDIFVSSALLVTNSQWNSLWSAFAGVLLYPIPVLSVIQSSASARNEGMGAILTATVTLVTTSNIEGSIYGLNDESSGYVDFSIKGRWKI